jgi:hypothetical protein
MPDLTFRNDAELETFLDGEPLDAEPAKAKSNRRPRKHSVDKLIAKARAAGASSVVVDGLEMRFAEPGTAAPTSTGDPWQADLERWRQ